MNCTSCNYEHKENYCPNCGEKKGIKKITLASIIDDAFSSITDMDKGFLFNIKTLILKPQELTADYIRGKRKGILNPVSFLIFCVTLYLIVITFFKVPKELNVINYDPESPLYKLGSEVGKFVFTNLKYFWILTVIPLGLSLKLAFKKFNYLEHLAISSFVIGQATLVGVISYMLFKMPLVFDPIVYFTIFWLIYKIYKKNNAKIESLVLSFAILILFIIQLIIIISIIGIIKA